MSYYRCMCCLLNESNGSKSVPKPGCFLHVKVVVESYCLESWNRVS